jgi:hypothetical protein
MMVWNPKHGASMIKRLTGSLLALVCALAAGAQELGFSAYFSPGASMAFGGDLTESLYEFEATVGSDALYAPVLGIAAGAGVDMAFWDALHLTGSLELRRLGYAFWAPESTASTWLTLWLAGLRLGLRYQPASWYAGAGVLICAPLSPIRSTVSRGAAGLSLNYDVDVGRSIIPGAYLEGGFPVALPIPLGPVYLRPRIGLEAGLWPAGLLDTAESWQLAVSAIAILDIERRLAR